MGILDDIATAVGNGFIQNSANNDAMYSEAFGFEPQPQLQAMSQAITTDLENKVEKARQQREIAAKQEAEKKRQQEEWNNSVLGKAEHWDNLEKATPWGNVTSYEIQQKAAEKIGEDAINSTVNYFKGAKAGYLAYADARNNFDKVAEYDTATGRYAPKEGYTQNDVDFAEEQVKKAGSAFRNETLYPGAMVLGVLGAPFTGGGSLALSGAAGLFSLGENVNSSMEEAGKRGETPLEIAREGVRTATYGPLVDTLTDPDLMKKLGDKPLSTFVDIAFSGMQAVAPLAMARAGVRSIKIPKEVLNKTPEEILAAASAYDNPPAETSQPAPKLPVGADVEDYEGVKPVGKEGANEFVGNSKNLGIESEFSVGDNEGVVDKPAAGREPGGMVDEPGRAEFETIKDGIMRNGPKWKSDTTLDGHVAKRIKKEHIPDNWTTKDYNNKIKEVLSKKNLEVYEYVRNEKTGQPFDQKYYIYGDGKWIVMVGENGVMETAFPPDAINGGYSGYLQGLKVSRIK